ncbi:hypothetical protein PaecuDRAFT_3782 [Paenibacillus curdlanolyticus YK9]|uniref:Uncharacterized protein n=1 Tax=Paenibacillus curdlanolyticus YK9 TaxID=717606 RepID=E0IDP1_9BACL|nr:hypothetical protein [Paenibacillus curdlanolyticus]EFM09245.1 hypothetical protein PaecuDRAFT_3782 [Paenibacillus curdlanolyticus YK9]
MKGKLILITAIYSVFTIGYMLMMDLFMNLTVSQSFHKLTSQMMTMQPLEKAAGAGWCLALLYYLCNGFGIKWKKRLPGGVE